MSNVIPPLLSSTPPPIGSIDDDDDDFGDFTVAVDNPYSCDSPSIPNTPQETPKRAAPENIDINSNSSINRITEKDHQDKRKCDTILDDMPNLSKVPSESIQKDFTPTSESATIVPEVKAEQVVTGDQNVPSSYPLECVDMYREEPPEIVPDEPDDDFGDFEYNVGLTLENDDDEPNIDMSIPVNMDVPEKNSDKYIIEDFEKLEITDQIIVEEIDVIEEINDLNVTHSDEIKSNNFNDLTDLKCNTDNLCNGGEFSVGTDSSSEDDDFGDFEFTTERKIEPVEDTDNFANFTSTETQDCEDDFGDFVTPSSESKGTENLPTFEATFPSIQQNEEESDFGDFDNGAPTVMLKIDSRNVSEKAKAILEEMFEFENVQCEEFHVCDFIRADGVFKEMMDITDTNALTYQWAKSQTQKELLKSLNIDTRNILYGPGINSMPKFAANLGLTPLEPVKSEVVAPTVPPATPSMSSQCNTVVTQIADIPSAQFDWNESGLANPLDSVSKEESPVNDLGESPINLTSNSIPQARKSYDNESVNSLQFADVTTEEDAKANEDDFCDFTSFNSEKRDSWPNNMVPLRETHINNTEVKKVEGSDEPGWLKPTILTPVLPRRDNLHEEDEFTDFQMSLPPDTTLSSLTVLPVSNAQDDNVPFVNPHNILQPVQILTQKKSTTIDWPDPGITEEELQRFEMYSRSNDEVKKSKTESRIVQRSDSQVEQKLSGNTGSMLVEKSVVVPANKVVLPSKEVLLPPNNKVVISKDLVLPILDSSPRKYTPLKNQSKDDEDWSDFIFNSEPVKPKMPQQTERTSTPELPLSIPQLSHIQPPKLPIPVITPQGLMQTKIPSMPAIQQKHVQAPLHLNPPQDGYQPAIISHQYAMQMNQNTFSGLLQNASYQTTSIPANMKTPPTRQQVNGMKPSSSFDDNDEWSDFVSSRPTTNGLPNPLSTEWNRSPQFNNWNIHNPIVYQNLMPHTNGTIPQKNNIPSISAMPDLDFVAPKSRTFNKK